MPENEKVTSAPLLVRERRGRHRARRSPSLSLVASSGSRTAPTLALAVIAAGAGTALALNQGGQPATAVAAAGSSTTSQQPAAEPLVRTATPTRSVFVSRASTRTPVRSDMLVQRQAKARQQAALAAAAAQKAAAEAKARAWANPMPSGRFTSAYKLRWGRLHAGIDLAAPIGTPVLAMNSGTVTFAGAKSGYGNAVDITMADGTLVRYGHLSRIDVKVGDTVGKGQAVAACGNSGRSTGPHLHLEFHDQGLALADDAVDPVPRLAERGLVIPGATTSPAGTPASGKAYAESRAKKA